MARLQTKARRRLVVQGYCTNRQAERKRTELRFCHHFRLGCDGTESSAEEKQRRKARSRVPSAMLGKTRKNKICRARQPDRNWVGEAEVSIHRLPSLEISGHALPIPVRQKRPTLQADDRSACVEAGSEGTFHTGVNSPGLVGFRLRTKEEALSLYHFVGFAYIEKNPLMTCGAGMPPAIRLELIPLV